MNDLSRFMSDFLIAASDYGRLNEAVRGFISIGDSSDIGLYVDELSESIAKAKLSITASVATGSDVAILDTLPEEVRDDVASAVRMAAYWMDRIRLLEGMIRTMAMESDADYIELILHARNGLESIDITSEDPIGPVTSEESPVEDEPVDEEQIEDESEETLEDSPEVFHDASTIDIIEIEDPESKEPQGKECRLRVPPEDDDLPAPLTKEDVQNIVLDTVTQLFAQNVHEGSSSSEEGIAPSSEPMEETTKPRKKSTTKKRNKEVRNILRKDEEASE